MDLFIQEADPHKTGKVIYKDFIKLMLNWLIINEKFYFVIFIYEFFKMPNSCK